PVANLRYVVRVSPADRPSTSLSAAPKLTVLRVLEVYASSPAYTALVSVTVAALADPAPVNPAAAITVVATAPISVRLASMPVPRRVPGSMSDLHDRDGRVRGRNPLGCRRGAAIR